MNNKDRHDSSVNGTRAASEGVTPGRVSGEQQPAPGRYPAPARTKWSKELNRLVMKSYIRSNPGTRGYRRACLPSGGRLEALRLASRD